MSTALSTMAGKLAARLGMDAGTDLMNTLKNTAFKGGNVTDEQFTALLIVANQYGLNPWTKEIYAFPDKGGIVPVVGVDGWARIINEHPQFDGMEFSYDKEEGACTCKIYRKDRKHPSVNAILNPGSPTLPACFAIRRLSNVRGWPLVSLASSTRTRPSELLKGQRQRFMRAMNQIAVTRI
jgi:hypothetical protein